MNDDLEKTRDRIPVKSELVVPSAKLSHEEKNTLWARHLLLPAIFLSTALLGGLRIDGTDASFIFLKPPLVCLLFAGLLMILFARSKALLVDGWFSNSFPAIKNAANGLVLISLFFASVQIFNALIPESGLLFWIVSFCFLWVLWNNLFSEFDPKRAFKSLGALFALAFVVRYVVLANLAAPEGQGWFDALTQNPGQTAATYLLSLPLYSGATGYIQFFTVVLYLFGLYLLPPSTIDAPAIGASKSPDHDLDLLSSANDS